MFPSVAASAAGDFWTLRRALDKVHRRGKITLRALEIVVGHIASVVLGARHALCTLHTCYRFMRAHYHGATRLWEDTRAELAAVRPLQIFSQREWTRTWNTRVFSTGSSLKDVVRRTGRASERRRFISGGPGARESALAGRRVVLDGDQWTVEGADDTDEGTCCHLDPSFEKVPFEWLERCWWNVSGCGRWNRREDIIILEARAWMNCVDCLCKGSTVLDAVSLFLGTTWLWY